MANAIADGDDPAPVNLEKGRLCLVSVLKSEAKELMDQGDYAGAIKKYDIALGILAEARMVALGMPAEDWERMKGAAEEACTPGEPWYFRILWGAMAQAGVSQDEEAAKLFSNMSLCHGRVKEWPMAGGAAQAALQLWPEWTKARYRLAEAMSHLGQHTHALAEAKRARVGMTKAESLDISVLQARLLARALGAARVGLENLDGLDTEPASQEQLEWYKALAQLERDVFRASSDWKEGLEAAAFPDLFPTGDGVWDVDRALPVRFDDFVMHTTKMYPQFQESGVWQSWAKGTSTLIRKGLEDLLAKASK